MGVDCATGDVRHSWHGSSAGAISDTARPSKVWSPNLTRRSLRIGLRQAEVTTVIGQIGVLDGVSQKPKTLNAQRTLNAQTSVVDTSGRCLIHFRELLLYFLELRIFAS